MLNTFKRKFSDLPQLLNIVEERRDRGEKVVFTNGCFDLLHIGHLRYLEAARHLGDFLIIGLNSDSSIRKIKGRSRPFLPEKERAEILSSLEFVDYIVIFEELTPCNLIENLKPDFHVKGGDYKREDLPELSVVESYGGEVVLLKEVAGQSTTNLVEKIYRKCYGVVEV